MTDRTDEGIDRYADVNGVSLHYVEWGGAGEPVLLVHGLTASARSLTGIAEALAPAHRVIAPDLRGRGRSGKPARGYSYAHHAADLIALLDALGIARAIAAASPAVSTGGSPGARPLSARRISVGPAIRPCSARRLMARWLAISSSATCRGVRERARPSGSSSRRSARPISM